jgi:acetyl esterase
MSLRKRAGSALISGFFEGVSKLGGLHPKAKPEAYGIKCTKNLVCGDHAKARLDVYQPKEPSNGKGVLYIHGGSFRILSKDSHWIMGLQFARRGYTVFNIDYRLAPKHRYPDALIDCANALRWVAKHATDWGADPKQLVLAGESAGANLATALLLALYTERDEPWARDLHQLGVEVRAVIPMCGVFQVSNAARLVSRRTALGKKPLPRVVANRVLDLEQYLPLHGPAPLADPLLILESEQVMRAPLPPFFLSVGTRDPLLDDTRRLAAALAKRNVPHEVKYQPGGFHAFQAFTPLASAQQAWSDLDAFLAHHRV